MLESPNQQNDSGDPSVVSILVPSQNRGFALLVTILLVSFLVLIVVGLATLTRVETQVATNSRQLSQAQQNALMALNIAIGELQKYTGPDQRTTARSDMEASLADTTTASGRWFGAYGSRAEADYAMNPTAASTAVVNGSDSIGRQSALLNWLVSGNENTAFSPAADVGPTGQILTPPTQFRFLPTAAVSGLNASSTALSGDLTVMDRTNAARPAQLLVGPNTVADSVTDYVVAPLQNISAVMPGTDGNPTDVGRYAWWIGDEGSKARANLPAASTSQKPNGFASTQRAAIELIDAANSSGNTTLATGDMLDPNGSAGRYDPSDPTLDRLIALNQIPHLNVSSAASLADAIQYRFHDLSVSSTSVLADTYAGGLKKDLSALLETGSVSPADTDFIYPPEPGSTHHLGVPTWGQLRSFAQTASPPSGVLPRAHAMASAPGYLNAPVPTNVGIYPVMSYAAFGFRYIAPDGDAEGQRISLVVAPIVVLWNPYTTTLRGTDDSGNPVRYEVGIRKSSASRIQLQGRAASTGGVGSYTWGPADVISTVDLGSYGSDRYYRFLVESPSGGIPPGKSLVFTLAQNGQDFTPGANLLTNGMNEQHYTVLAAFDQTITPALGAGAYYRVGVNGQARNVNGTTVPQTMWNAGNDGNWGGAGVGWHEAYLAQASTGAGYPNNAYPWSSSLGSEGIHQSFSHLPSPGMATPPYGSNNAATGYAVSSGATGLLQPEGTLGTNLITHPPAFRMAMYSVFSNMAAPSAGLTIGRIRWMLQYNIRGFMMAHSATITGQPSQTSWPFNVSSADDVHAPSGTGLNEPLNDTVLYEFRPDTMPLLGIGQLQHANLGWISNAPAYAIGNSNGSGQVHYNFDSSSNVTATFSERLVNTTRAISTNAPGNRITARYDHSWLLNRALWDRYFVSTVPHPGTGRQATPADTAATPVPDVLPNPLHIRHGNSTDAELRDADIVAAKLLLSGGFNVNSTSEQAWRAVLGGSNRLDHDPTGANTGGTAWDKITYSRFSQPDTNSRASPWAGYIQLDEVQIAQLARNLVAEVRSRGPFVSLADFINRRLQNGEASRLKGTLQAAIDATTSGPGAINSTDVGSPLHDFAGINPSYKIINSFRRVSQDAWETGSDDPAAPVAPYGTSGAGSPQFLTQADVLASIGSKLTARSDTFVIRTYGDTLDSVNSTVANPVVTGRAWCEAILQRLPEYVDDSMPAETDLRSAPNSAAKITNQQFGRKYKIISFRWLSHDDI